MRIVSTVRPPYLWEVGSQTIPDARIPKWCFVEMMQNYVKSRLLFFKKKQTIKLKQVFKKQNKASLTLCRKLESCRLICGMPGLPFLSLGQRVLGLRTKGKTRCMPAKAAEEKNNVLISLPTWRNLFHRMSSETRIARRWSWSKQTCWPFGPVHPGSRESCSSFLQSALISTLPLSHFASAPLLLIVGTLKTYLKAMLLLPNIGLMQSPAMAL